MTTRHAVRTMIRALSHHCRRVAPQHSADLAKARMFGWIAAHVCIPNVCTGSSSCDFLFFASFGMRHPFMDSFRCSFDVVFQGGPLRSLH